MSSARPAQPLKLVIACGGTGGHLFPGLAVAQEWHARGHEALLIVSEKAIDTTALKAHPEFRTHKLPSIGMPSVFSPAFIRFLRRLWESTSMCRHLYRKYQPDLVLGMGGFTSTPPILAARQRRLPSFVHESNAIPGKANRFSSRFTRKVLLGFEETRELFRQVDCLFTGTPVRTSIGQRLPRADALARFRLQPDRKTLLVMGGSQGAAGINQLLFRIAGRLAAANFQIIHLAGERDDQLAAANYQRDGLPNYVAAFHDRMEEAYSAADLIVSRAGASSLNEISRFGLASILIPYPFAADNHQEANARIFVRRGAAEMIVESESTAENFGLLVENLLSDDPRRERMASLASAIQPHDAAARVADVLERELQP
jgi:UDP-N-acetylglucosamine--N-acetylmuramyl-(pentapeptide) pyrophosphoryl-undecaprenol N-acetylglucosamine transferase